jgi:hypothetical protein
MGEGGITGKNLLKYYDLPIYSFPAKNGMGV